MKKKTLYLDAQSVDFLNKYDGRKGGIGQGKIARSCLAIHSVLADHYGEKRLCKAGKMIRNGKESDALSLLGIPTGDEKSSEHTETNLGDGEDGVGGDLPPVPGVETQTDVESAPKTSESPPEGDTEGQEGEDHGPSSDDSDGGIFGVGEGLVTKVIRGS